MESFPTKQPPGTVQETQTELPAWISPALIEKTLEIWQPYYSYRLTTDDALAIIKSVGDLFEVLSRGTD